MTTSSLCTMTPTRKSSYRSVSIGLDLTRFGNRLLASTCHSCDRGLAFGQSCQDLVFGRREKRDEGSGVPDPSSFLREPPQLASAVRAGRRLSCHRPCRTSPESPSSRPNRRP